MTYSDARSGVERHLVRGSFAKADVFISRFRDRLFIVKDFGTRGAVERNFIGRIVIGRECRAYEALAGIEGLPSRYKRLTPYCLAVEFLEGRDLGGVERHELGPGVIRQFERIIDGLHDRGWVHLDLHRRTNILLVNERVFVIDLASALHPGAIPFIGRFLVAMIGIPDRLAIIKLKTLFAPELLTPAERKFTTLRNLFMRTKWDV